MGHLCWCRTTYARAQRTTISNDFHLTPVRGRCWTLHRDLISISIGKKLLVWPKYPAMYKRRVALGAIVDDFNVHTTHDSLPMIGLLHLTQGRCSSLWRAGGLLIDLHCIMAIYMGLLEKHWQNLAPRIKWVCSQISCLVSLVVVHQGSLQTVRINWPW